MIKKTLLVALVFTAIAGVAQAAPQGQVDGLRRMAFSGRASAKADQIVVYKGKRLMYLMRQGRILRKYHIALGKNPIGHKIESGDYRTPEGRYTIDMKNASSAYLLSLRVSYPDAVDAQVANALDTRPGDWIMIHGLPNGRTASDVGHPDRDWTNGCIAVTDAEIIEIWQMVDRGAKISIWP
jgi:murein L,D-transpeptidase YafK